MMNVAYERKERFVRLFPAVMMFILTVVLVIFAGCGSKNTVHDNGTQDAFEDYDTVVVAMKGIDDDKVIVFASEHARVIVSYNSLMNDLQTHIDHYDVQDDRDLKKELLSLAEKGDTVNTVEICDDRMLRERIAFRLAEILEKGDAIVVDLKTGEKVSTIMVEHYAVQFHKLAGRGGRLFMLPRGVVFLEVLDWIS